MLLMGLSFENLIKGVHIAQTPRGSIEDRMKIWKSHRGGHGISILIKVVTSISSIEENLLKRLEEYAFWAGRYPIPVHTKQYIKSIKPHNLSSFTTQDPGLCDTLFERLASMIRTTTLERSPNPALQRPGDQRCFSAQSTRHDSGVVSPAPLSLRVSWQNTNERHVIAP
jgi:hypothetical protein